MREMEVVALEVVRIFIKQTVKGFGGPFRHRARIGTPLKAPQSIMNLSGPYKQCLFTKAKEDQVSKQTQPLFVYRG